MALFVDVSGILVNSHELSSGSQVNYEDSSDVPVVVSVDIAAEEKSLITDEYVSGMEKAIISGGVHTVLMKPGPAFPKNLDNSTKQLSPLAAILQGSPHATIPYGENAELAQQVSRELAGMMSQNNPKQVLKSQDLSSLVKNVQKIVEHIYQSSGQRIPQSSILSKLTEAVIIQLIRNSKLRSDMGSLTAGDYLVRRVINYLEAAELRSMGGYDPEFFNIYFRAICKYLRGEEVNVFEQQHIARLLLEAGHDEASQALGQYKRTAAVSKNSVEAAEFFGKYKIEAKRRQYIFFVKLFNGNLNSLDDLQLLNTVNKELLRFTASYSPYSLKHLQQGDVEIALYPTEPFIPNQNNVSGYGRTTQFFGKVGRFGFGLALPGVAAIGATSEAIALAHNPYASSAEKVAASSTSFLGILDVVASVTYYFKPASALGSFAAKSLPILGSAFSIAGGSTRVLRGRNLTYVNGVGNMVSGALEMLSVPAGLLTFMVLPPSLVTALFGFATAGTLGFAGATVNEKLTRRGFAQAIAKEVKRQIHLSTKDSNGYITAAAHDHAINYEMNRALAYHIFDNDAVLEIISELSKNESLHKMNWREDEYIQSLRALCYDILVAESQSILGLNEEEAATLLFLGIQSSDEGQQVEAFQLFFEAAGESDTSAKAIWQNFVEKHELDEKKYGSLEKLIENFVSEKLKMEKLSSYLFRLIRKDGE
ncbi:MAG: hypothetical protein H7A32_01050 [Deltaproteobacteria bacterium]|nr:hypothetical protein [Deltaproteobacteria bacterium]